MYTIYKVVGFAAAHHLTNVEPDHQCARVHGHNYRVEFELSSLDLDEHGFVLDYGVLKELVSQYDHRDLNDFLENPTAELLAQELALQLDELLPPFIRIRYIRVHENDTSWAEYRV